MNIDGPYILSDSMNTYLVINVSFPCKQIKCISTQNRYQDFQKYSNIKKSLKNMCWVALLILIPFEKVFCSWSWWTPILKSESKF